MEVLKVKDKVKYENEVYLITRVWNHGYDMVYYDLEAENDLLGIGFKKRQLSVHYTELFKI